MKKIIIAIIILYLVIFIFNTTIGASNFSGQIIEDMDERERAEIRTNALSGNLILVDREKSLPSNYVPSDMVIPNIPFTY